VLLPITTDVLVEEAQRLGADGHRYSSRQLYYAVCRAVERPSVSITRGLIGLGAILVVLAGAVLWVRSFPLSLILAVIGVLLLLAAPVNAHVELGRERRRAGTSRTLAASYDGFVSGALAEARSTRPEAFAALLAAGAASAAVPGAGGGPLVVCDRAETAKLLAANAGRLPEGVEVAEVTGLLGGDGRLEPGVRERRLVAVHDAGPAGCALPSVLRGAGAGAVVDAGLRPPASDAGLQVIEGAPARLPEGIEADLAPAQVEWLRSGRRLELATLAPDELLALVAAACEPPAAPAP
jgi:hypothetical protein